MLEHEEEFSLPYSVTYYLDTTLPRTRLPEVVSNCSKRKYICIENCFILFLYYKQFITQVLFLVNLKVPSLNFYV